MHKFWYHSPVRFYRTLEELQDATNPQNTQYFGMPGNPYPLEYDILHRFLIPNYQNEIVGEGLELWCGDVQLGCEFGISGGKLFRISFYSEEIIQGRLEIKLAGETIFYSNCVQFVDSTDQDGRKFIRIATKHYYNRGLFAFDGSNFDWIITNLPAYCLGQFTADAEVNNSRTGGNNTLRPRETYIDEVVSYQFDAHGDANILSFIQVHVTNNEFYIDGTKRTAVDKLDADESGMFGKMKFTNQKDENGFNISLDEDLIFGDVLRYALADENSRIIYDNNNNAIIEGNE